MELGQYQLQVFISLIVILAAAAVALICDFLKANNEKLRELNLELRIRREEEHQRVRMAVARQPQKRTTGRKKPAHKPVLVTRVPVARIAPPRPQEVVMETVAASAPSALNWHSVLVAGRRASLVPREARPNLLQQVVAATATSSAEKAREAEIPPGLQDGYVLTQLVQSRQPISGLIVSIGVEAKGTPQEQVVAFIQTLLGSQDFAAQSAEDEFLLIFPHERGSAAQRRLTQISQQIADFQRRSTEKYSVRFSWGGLEVRSENISDAIASASQRMLDTKKSAAAG